MYESPKLEYPQEPIESREKIAPLSAESTLAGVDLPRLQGRGKAAGTARIHPRRLSPRRLRQAEKNREETNSLIVKPI